VGLLTGILFDRERRRVTGMSVATCEEPRGNFWLDLGRVVKIGDAAVFVDSGEALRPDVPKTDRYTDLLERRTVSERKNLLPALSGIRGAEPTESLDEPAA
jgi:hypothetical protein